MLFNESFLMLAILAGFLGLDATSMVQTLVSRPLLAGGLAGWALGDLGAGLATGSLVELLWMGGVPVGSLVPPDGTVAAIFSAAVGICLPRMVPDVDPMAAASLGLLAAVPVGMLGAKVEIFQRRLNDRLSRRLDAELDEGRMPNLGAAILGGLILAFVRSFLVALLVLSVGLPALALLMGSLPSDAMVALHWAYCLAWLLGLAVAADYFWDRRGLKYLGLILVATAVLASRPGVSQSQLLAIVLSVALLGGLGRWRKAWVQAHEEEAL